MRKLEPDRKAHCRHSCALQQWSNWANVVEKLRFRHKPIEFPAVQANQALVPTDLGQIAISSQICQLSPPHEPCHLTSWQDERLLENYEI